MGCKQSTPATDTGTAPNAERKAVGATERLMSAQLKRQQELEKNGQPTVSLQSDEEVSKELPKLRPDGTLMPEEIVRRTSSSLTNSSIPIGNRQKSGRMFQLDYAHWAQRGYYPDNPHKMNQDAFGITLKFAGEDGDALFCVYDGHGDEGHKCAQFAKKKYPQILAKLIRQKRVQRYTEQLKAEGMPTKGAWNPTMWPLLRSEDHEVCCKKAFRETNKLMHDDTCIPDRLSGTTALSVSFHGGRMTVCNVGDCRAVLGHRIKASKEDGREEDVKEDEKCEEEEKCEIGAEEKEFTNRADNASFKGEYLAIPLSKDQTPYRKDERERLRAAGAEIKSIDQLEGREPMHDNWGDLILGKEVDILGDPPRVWVKGEQYPGTAFSRSLGDKIAKDIGVNCEPEMLTTELTRNDKYLVIASDGIFEFLTNQEVIDVCHASESPLQACSTLVREAYDKWLVYERRTDDITCIVCFLENPRAPQPGEKGTTEDLVEAADDVYGWKPLRPELPRGEGSQRCIVIEPSGQMSPNGGHGQTIEITDGREEEP